MIHSRKTHEDNDDYFKRILREDDSSILNTISKSDRKKLHVAFEQAHDIRKFEIELFWKRATHFWIFISVVFAGYGGLWLALFKNLTEPAATSYYNTIGCIFLLILNIVGFTLSWVWIRVMSGSKFWQENWESHIDFLESSFSGHLHKTVFYPKKGTPKHYSVSALSMAVGYLFLLAWVVVYLCSAWTFLQYSKMSERETRAIILLVAIGTLFIVKTIDCKCKRSPGNKALNKRISVMTDSNDHNSYFFTKSAPWYVRFNRSKKVVVFLLIISSIILLLIPGLPKIFEAFQVTYSDLAQTLASVMGALLTIIVAICAGFVVNWEFFSQTSRMDKFREEELSFQMVKNIFSLAIKASEVIAICTQKKGCTIFDESIRECSILKNGTEEDADMPEGECGEFAANPTEGFYNPDGEDISCQVIKMVHRQREGIRAEMTRYAELSMFRFPEVYAVIAEFYLLYVAKNSNPYLESMHSSYLMFFKALAALPDRFFEIYASDDLFSQKIRKYLDDSYEHHNKQNQPRSLGNIASPYCSFIRSEVVFKRFNKMMSTQLNN